MRLFAYAVQVDDIDVHAIGPKFESNAVFPARTNTEFVEVLSRDHVRMVVWERGAGRTLACGTGACATVASEEGLSLVFRDTHCVRRCRGHCREPVTHSSWDVFSLRWREF